MDLFLIIFLSIVGGSVCTYVLLTFMQKERKNFTSEEFKNIKSSIDEILEIAEDEKKNRLISISFTLHHPRIIELIQKIKHMRKSFSSQEYQVVF